MDSIKQYLPFFLLLICLFGCEKDDGIGEENDEEVITTLLLKFSPQDGGDTLEFKYEDSDGPGGATPIIETIQLANNKRYNVELLLLNITTNPVDSISNEVEEEGVAHRFYYLPQVNSNINVINLNEDENGFPLGLHSVWVTGSESFGSINIVLRHYIGFPPDKAQDDPVDSNKSSTDIDVTFKTQIQ